MKTALILTLALLATPVTAFVCDPETPSSSPAPEPEPPQAPEPAKPDNDHDWKPVTPRVPVECGVGWVKVRTFWRVKCVREEGVTDQSVGGKWGE